MPVCVTRRCAEPLLDICKHWLIAPDTRRKNTAVRLPSPLPPSTEALKDPPKEVALLQDEETLFLDEDTLPAEVCPYCDHSPQLALSRSTTRMDQRSVSLCRSFSWNTIRSIGSRFVDGIRPTCSGS